MAVSINRDLDRFYSGLYILQAVLLLSISSVSLAGPFDGGNKKKRKYFTWRKLSQLSRFHVS